MEQSIVCCNQVIRAVRIAHSHVSGSVVGKVAEDSPRISRYISRNLRTGCIDPVYLPT